MKTSFPGRTSGVRPFSFPPRWPNFSAGAAVISPSWHLACFPTLSSMPVRFLLLALLLIWEIPAWACTCTPPATLEAALAQADVAFVGRCTFAESNWISGGMKYSFEVSQSWKKTTSQLFILSTPWEQDCGDSFEPGQSYLVFVRRKFTPKTYQCMGNQPLDDAQAALAALGPGLSPAPSSLLMPMYWTLGILGALALLLIGFVVLRKRGKS